MDRGSARCPMPSAAAPRRCEPMTARSPHWSGGTARIEGLAEPPRRPVQHLETVRVLVEPRPRLRIERRLAVGDVDVDALAEERAAEVAHRGVGDERSGPFRA